MNIEKIYKSIIKNIKDIDLYILKEQQVYDELNYRVYVSIRDRSIYIKIRYLQGYTIITNSKAIDNCITVTYLRKQMNVFKRIFTLFSSTYLKRIQLNIQDFQKILSFILPLMNKLILIEKMNL